MQPAACFGDFFVVVGVVVQGAGCCGKFHSPGAGDSRGALGFTFLSIGYELRGGIGLTGVLARTLVVVGVRDGSRERVRLVVETARAIRGFSAL